MGLLFGMTSTCRSSEPDFMYDSAGNLTGGPLKYRSTMRAGSVPVRSGVQLGGARASELLSSSCARREAELSAAYCPIYLPIEAEPYEARRVVVTRV